MAWVVLAAMINRDQARFRRIAGDLFEEYTFLKWYEETCSIGCYLGI